MDRRDYKPFRGRRGHPRHSRGSSNRYNASRDPRNQEKLPKVDDLEVRLNDLIIMIGDDKAINSLDSNIDFLSRALITDIKTHKNTILDTIFKCVLALPTKTGIYGSLVGLLNLSNKELGKEVVDRVREELQVALKRLELYNIKFLLRFLGELYNACVIDAQSLIDVYTLLLKILEVKEYPQSYHDFFLFLIASSLPFVGPKLSKANSAQLENLLTQISTGVKDRDKKVNKTIMIFQSEDPLDYFDWILQGLVQQKESGWPNISILQCPYKFFETKFEQSFEHTFPASDLTLPHIEDPKNAPGLGEQSLPVRLPLFPNSRLPDSLSLIDQVLLHDVATDLLYFFNPNRALAVKFLLSLSHKENLEPLFVETIFSQLFRLPKAPFRTLYYSAILIEMSKSRSDTFSSTIGRAGC
eukprot:TRINITY_DN555_c0_g2_i1.p1 TRINITY_DN555_c0_g2~~TRINITY_DN555_c0_g2_i1.p1  ORF type:complete len:413 (-),score=58.51 TRINITY_DN555_c0_g2_i1:884-2122(-)